MSNKVNHAEVKIDFKTIESKWRISWQELDLYKTGDDPNKPNVYILDYFPYPSGDGLSVGHCRNYVPTCVSARFHRMKGYNVLHPMGWDAFGLPAENYAVKHGIHPHESSEQFCATYRRQMKLVECSYDWSREFSSTDPDYYRWTQWFFLLLYRRGLAYRAKGSQWFCPQCSTILANEQVEDGRCWRCDTTVTRKELEQWYFKITAYADRLLDDLATIEWPESIKASQQNWIGRSEGVEVIFSIAAAEGSDGDGEEIVVFTTRPDTLYGVTFLALAPEHPLVAYICTDEKKAAVEQYIQRAQRQTDTDRTSTTKEKIGVFSGAYAVHPLTREQVPIWIADYVLPGYGTGAIMGVPGHDQRDRQFADKNGLLVVTVVHPEDGEEVGCFEDRGILVNSGPYSGQDSAVAMEGISDELETGRLGKRSISYKMRDWLISRQRYWGAPIPIIHCPVCGIVPVPEEELPVCLPEILYGDICHLSYDKFTIMYNEVMFMNENEYKRRLAKTPEIRFLNILEQEYEYSPRIAEAILEDAHACLHGEGRAVGPGQMRVILVKRGAPHGRRLKEVEKVEVVWTIDGGQEDREVAEQSDAQRLRQVRIQRLLDEALAQRAAATQEDLAEALQVSVRTIKRDCAQMKAEGIYVPTRGNLQGIGRGQTHKAQIVARWLNGETYDQIVLHTHHSTSSVKRYVQMCQRVFNLEMEGFGVEEIALLLQIGRPLVREYLAVCQECDTPLARKRLNAQRNRLKREVAKEKRGLT